MKLKRLACGALSVVMCFSLLAGPGGFVIPARADHDTPDEDPAIQTDAVYDEFVPDAEVPEEDESVPDAEVPDEDESVPDAEVPEEIELLDEMPEPEDSELDTYYEEMRENWRAFLLGGNGDDLDLTNPVIASYVNDLNREANGYWNDLVVRSDEGYGYYIFSDLNIQPLGPRVTGAEATQRTANMGNTFRHLVALAKAWSTQGCDLYGDETVLEEIIKATDYMVDNFYGKDMYTKTTSFGNWYQWDITNPTALGNITMILYDVLGAERVQKYAETVEYYASDCSIPGPNSLCSTQITGGNLLLKANATAQAGILLKKDSLLENVRANVKTTVSTYNDPSALFANNNVGDGFYADGSYIQHSAIPYIAGYGADLYNNFSTFGRLLKGTPWEIAYEDDETPLIFNFVFDGIEPFIAGSRTMDMVAGRDISRNGSSDRKRTASILSALLPMQGTFPTEEQNQRFDEMMKYCLSQNLDFYYSQISNITAIKIAVELMGDDSISHRSEYALTKTFAMDRTVHHTSDFVLGIAMHSTRIFAHEIINYEGKQTWNIANGMVFLYDADEDQYAGGYWGSVDQTRLPGTTTEHVLYPIANSNLNSSGNGGLNANIYDWTGGSSIGNNGVAGTHMRALSRTDSPKPNGAGVRNGADMKKSWFMFGDRILALGSSITSTTNDNVETTVENRKIRLDGSNVVTVDGSAANLSTDSAAPTVLENPSWIHLEGNVAGADIGYYFPEDITLNAMKDNRTGNWEDLGTTTGTATNTYATFYVDHGVKPKDAGYAYVLLPGKSAAQTAAYAADPDIEILQNDGNIHAARDNSQNILAANFWTAGAIDKIAVDTPASVIMQQGDDGVVTIGVSDPTKKASSITVTLAMPGEVISKDSTVDIVESKGFLRFTVDTTDGLGATHTLTIRADESGEVELMGAVSVFEPITVDFGTPFYKFYDLVDMPEKAEFLATDGKTYELELNWSRGDYDATAIGEFTIEGWPVLPAGLNNSAEVYAQMKVKTGGQREVLAIADTYTNDGNNADKNYSTTQNMLAQVGGTNYARKAFIQFDLTNIPAGAESYKLAITAYWYEALGINGVGVYQNFDNIDLSTLTWNTTPADSAWTKVTTFDSTNVVEEWQGSDRTFAVLSIDVTDAIEQALKDGETKVTFMMYPEGTSTSNNRIYIYSIETTNADAKQKPAIISEVSGGGPANDKDNLRFLLEEADKLDGDRFLNYDAEALAEAVTAGQAVYDDPTATQEHVNDAEDALMRILLGLRLITEQPEGS